MKEWLEGLGLSKETIDSVMAYISNLAVNYAGKVAGAIVILMLAMFISGWVRSMVEKALTRVNFDPTLTKFFGTASRWVVLLLAVLGCLGMFGIETTSFAAVIGGASLAIGLAFQGSLSNVAAGVMLLTFRPFSVGQVITVAGQTGKVDEIGLFTTALNTPDNRHIIIPNGQVFGSTIVNITHNPKRRVDVNIGIGYGDDLDETRRVLVEAGEAITQRIEGEPVVAFLSEYADSSVNWQVRIWAKTEDYWVAYEALMREVKIRVEAAGLDIPYPNMVVHRADSGGAEA
jgi:small conductance mechanosensitive channel